MTKRIGEIVSAILLLAFIWISALAGDFITVHTFQIPEATLRNPWWVMIFIGLIQLVLMYIAAIFMFRILAPANKDNRNLLLASLILWLALSKVLAFPRLASTVLPGNMINGGSVASTTLVVAVHFVATYMLVLTISRLLIRSEAV